MYNKFGLSRKGKAGFDLGFTFGLASNAIPATGWMLIHILNPSADKTLLPRVMAELQSARLPDGSLNLPALFALPLIQSILHEVLRLYTDVLVSKTLEKDHVLPLSGPGNRQALLQKGTLAFAPSWPMHRDSTVWAEPAHDVFYAERFLTTDPKTGKNVFSISGTAGRFFPFGGGKTICPGRVFAKQEVLTATALSLLEFNFNVQGFVDSKGKSTNTLPTLRDGLGGSGVILQSGDIKVRTKRRKGRLANDI
jgi:cytochrome P450